MSGAISRPAMAPGPTVGGPAEEVSPWPQSRGRPAHPSRPLRRDAERNRTRILAAAQELLVDRGLDVGVDEIARRAGVGMGTLYRRFPNKDALIDAILQTVVDELRGLAQDVAANEPPPTALRAFLLRAFVLDPGRGAFLAQRLWYGRSGESMFREVVPLLREMFVAAQRAGAVRWDAEVTDVILMMRSMRVVADLTEKTAPGYWKRALDIVLAGLRPDPSNVELPQPQVSLDVLGTPGNR